MKNDLLVQSANAKSQERLLASALCEMGHIINKIKDKNILEIIEERYKGISKPNPP